MFTTAQAMNIVRPVIADQLQQFPAFMQISIAKFMKDQGGTGGATSRAPVFNSGNILYKTSGALFTSFIKNDPNNVYRASQSGNQFTLEYGSKIPYAKIHEYGGFIAAKKRASSVKRNKEVWVMSQYFWRKYMETKAPFFKRIALSIEVKGGVNMRARPYWNPAIKDFKSNGQPKFEQAIKQAIVLAVIDLQNRTRN